ncbi:MAG: prepilin-type N-terminal cleavage/methylation domain-containing protein [Epsilonproteobacteria bacterium]|nr:prepilin-type N-terminal cleavage/methylation domain-containing protein [Campylobacterota bacterium]
MKKGLTLIELIFVIIIIGILAAVTAPRFSRPSLHEAAHQLISHIQYTQHLAMIDNKFDPSDAMYHTKRWQLQFLNVQGSDNQWSYTIFSDDWGAILGNAPDGTANRSEIARNTLNPTSQFMTGGYGNNILPYIESGAVNPEITKEMNIGHKYDISAVKTGDIMNRGVSFHGGCNNVSLRISFDYLGRPLFGALNNMQTSYALNGTTKLIQAPCDIRLLNSAGESITIRIEQETGHTYIL